MDCLWLWRHCLRHCRLHHYRTRPYPGMSMVRPPHRQVVRPVAPALEVVAFEVALAIALSPKGALRNRRQYSYFHVAPPRV